MQAPKETAALIHFRRATVFTVRKLLAASMKAQADDCRAVFKALTASEMALLDADDPVTEALADRELADAQLDPVAANITLKLGSRSGDAKKKAPWTQIFPEGVLFYTTSPVSEQVDRYGKLAERMQQFLPAGDELLAEIPKIREGLTKWQTAVDSLRVATVRLESARAARAQTELQWRTYMDRLYSGLRAELGKEAAEAFFRKPTRRVGGKGELVDEGGDI